MKILIVDDHPLIREALGSVLATLDNEIEVIEVGDVSAALTLAGQYGDLGLILLDIYMPGMSGLDALDSFRTQFPEIPVVVMSGSENRADVMRAIDGGAMGFLPKSQPSRMMVNALRLVLAGGVYLPVEMLGMPAAAAPAHVTFTTGWSASPHSCPQAQTSTVSP